jgi:hypothetical protein
VSAPAEIDRPWRRGIDGLTCPGCGVRRPEDELLVVARGAEFVTTCRDCWRRQNAELNVPTRTA